MNIKMKIAFELAKIAEEIIAGRPRMTNDEFVERAREVHGDAYDYSKVDMDNRDEKGRVLIKCKKCGNEFWQRPDKHLDGNGCMNCYIEEIGVVPGQDMDEENQFDYSDEPVQQPVQQPVNQPVQQPVQNPVQQPVQKAPAEQTSKTLNDTSTQYQPKQSAPLKQPLI